MDAFQPGRSDACWECGSINHRRSQCPVLKQRWSQGRPPMDTSNSSSPPNGIPTTNGRGGVTLTEVHGSETNVSTVTAAAVTTRSKATPTNHVVEHRKPFPEKHWERLHTLRKDMQKELEATTMDQGATMDQSMQQILNDTNVTITLSKLLQLSPELQNYLQRATLT